MKLKKLLFLEITVILFLLLSIFAYIELSSYLGLSKSVEIGLYKEREYANGNVTVLPGETAIAQFAYLSYEPTIVAIKLTFRSVAKPGFLVLRCNNRLLESIWVDQENYTVNLNAVSFSGAGWVEPLSSMFGLNEVTFESKSENGLEGTVDYQIKLRGTT